MARKQTETAEPVNPLGWMTTFSDLVTLLLTFFVLLISMSSMDVVAVQEAFGFFNSGTGALESDDQGQMAEIISIISSVNQPDPQLLMENKRLKDLIFQFNETGYQKVMEILDKEISVTVDENGLAIRLSNFILFNEGESDLRMENIPLLTRLAEVFRAVAPYPISIEGHTDGSPGEGGASEKAFHLSLARAITISEYFINQEGLNPGRLRVGGYGPSKPAPNGPGLNNPAENRRIEILIYKHRQ